MGKINTQFIRDFSGGMTNDLRTSDLRYSKLIKGFDAHSLRHKLTPFKTSESGNTNGDTDRMRAFCIALLTGTTYALYGLGRISGASERAEVNYKKLTLGSAEDLDDADWTATSNQQSGTGTSTNYNLFVYYQRVGLIFGARDGTNLWAYDPDGSTAFNDDATGTGLTYTNIAQGLVHSKDDILYIPYDNIIAINNNGSWNKTALTLPTNLRINSICEYGNYLAIGCQPVSGFGKSVVFLWDRDATLSTVSESIDWGEGNLFILEEVDGYLIGISNVGAGSASLAKTTQNQRIVFRYYGGGKPIVFKEFTSSETSTSLSVQIDKQKVNNYLYFFLAMTFPDGTVQEGLWKLGRNLQNPNGGWTVTFDRGANNDTNTTSGNLHGFIVVGDFVFIAYDDNGTFAVSKTKEIGAGSEYTATSIYESVILNEGDTAIKKKLRSVTVYTEPLPSGGQVLVRYKIDDTLDDTSSFTTILTHSTANALNKTAINIESTGVALPEYKELILRCESTGGAVITGLKYQYEVVGKDLLD